MPHVSVIIPTYGRSESLRDCIDSIHAQTYQDYEIIKVTEIGELAALRNDGARRAKGDIIVFIDDDVVCSPQWLENLLIPFGTGSIAGVTGPAVIKGSFRSNRDIFRFPFISTLYRFLFCGRKRNLPGHITRAGAWTPGATDQNCKYEGPVEFLEACNMAFRRDVFWEVGGFDEGYRGIGDWSEPDLAFRVRKAGYGLWFSRNAALEHRPSRSGAYDKRRSKCFRMENYLRFSSRWVKPCWQHSLHKQFLKIYFWLKEHRCL